MKGKSINETENRPRLALRTAAVKPKAAEDPMQIVQNCEDKAVRDKAASEPWQKILRLHSNL